MTVTPIDRGEEPRKRGGRKSPHDLEAEERALGCMFANAADRAFMLDVLRGEDFYKPRHSAIFGAIGKLVERGSGVDVTTVADELARAGKLDLCGGRSGVLEVATSSGIHPRDYAGTVAQLAACRRAIAWADEISTAGYTVDLDALDRVLDLGPEHVFAHLEAFFEPEPGFDPAGFMDRPIEEVRPRQWIVPDLLELGDRVIISGGEGGGKSTFFRQFLTQTASGIHPFTLADIPARRGLYFDLQDSSAQMEREWSWLAGKTRGRLAPGMLAVQSRRQGMNILNRGDRRYFEQCIERSHAEIVAFGPLYKIFRAPKGRGKHDEEVAEEVCGVLDEVATRYGCAFMIEAHSPHGDGGDRANYRPTGAAVWLRWPEFGFGMKPIRPKDGEQSPGVELRRFRLDRDRDRAWPRRLFYGSVWPWESPPEEVF